VRTKTVALRGLTWNHPRGFDALVQASREFHERHPDVEVAWSARSLAEFEDVPLRELAPHYDLVAIDHPFVGEAEAESSLVPLDELIGPEVLAEQAASSVGPSFASYTWNGRQWALAMDVAAQVSAWRSDLLDARGLDPPVRLGDIADLAASLTDVAVAIPAKPTHLYSSLLSLCQLHAGPTVRQADLSPSWWSAKGLDPDVAVPALERLREILALALPESLELDPIDVLDRMSGTDTIAYVPLTFGYANYSRDGCVARAISFGNVPVGDDGPAGLLGGVGIAVSASCREPEAAARFVVHVTSEACQRGAYFEGGGQPGHRRAWLDEDLNRATRGFFAATLPTLDNACVRPRLRTYPRFQKRAALLVHEGVRRSEPSGRIVEALNELWRAVTAEDPSLERSP